MLIMALIQFVITIWCAALCCGAVCYCCKGSGGHVVRITNQFSYILSYQKPIQLLKKKSLSFFIIPRGLNVY